MKLIKYVLFACICLAGCKKDKLITPETTPGISKDTTSTKSVPPTPPVIPPVTTPPIIPVVDSNVLTTTQINRSLTLDSLGACQGISYQNGKIFLYGDREVGVIRSYAMSNGELVDQHTEYKLTVKKQDIISHPTGLAYNGESNIFMGNSVKQPNGSWTANIFLIDWDGLQRTGTLDNNLLNTINDDIAIQGTRPEYVKYKDKWYVATSDYGDNGNEIRLYDPEVLKTAKKTSEPGVLFKKFSCTPWVQNLHWIASKNILVLIQNQLNASKWRFTYINLEKSIDEGQMDVIKVVDIERTDELEGFSYIGNSTNGIAVTSAAKNNINFTLSQWQPK